MLAAFAHQIDCRLATTGRLLLCRTPARFWHLREALGACVRVLTRMVAPAGPGRLGPVHIFLCGLSVS